ncbi:MAG: hypothetical protein V4649_05235 [Bacteroidota bacterium]
MHEVTVAVPDNKLSFFLELIEHLGFSVESNLSIVDETEAANASGIASKLRGKLSPMTNEDIDRQFKAMR